MPVKLCITELHFSLHMGHAGPDKTFRGASSRWTSPGPAECSLAEPRLLSHFAVLVMAAWKRAIHCLRFVTSPLFWAFSSTKRWEVLQKSIKPCNKTNQLSLLQRQNNPHTPAIWKLCMCKKIKGISSLGHTVLYPVVNLWEEKGAKMLLAPHPLTWRVVLIVHDEHYGPQPCSLSLSSTSHTKPESALPLFNITFS